MSQHIAQVYSSVDLFILTKNFETEKSLKRKIKPEKCKYGVRKTATIFITKHKKPMFLSK